MGTKYIEQVSIDKSLSITDRIYNIYARAVKTLTIEIKSIVGQNLAVHAYELRTREAQEGGE